MSLNIFIFAAAACILFWLAAEKRLAARDRSALRHIVHVNGTRGKSGVARLIAAGLAAGGVKTYCKTTGTLPMTIDPNGNEVLIRRLGRANIREQIQTLHKAVKSGAEVLVIECMAVDPELQYVCEHEILHADIAVLTNVRVDHVAEMGATLPEVCEALCNTIPKNGRVFTAEKECLPQIEATAARCGSTVTYAGETERTLPGEMFPENIALALAVCAAVGVDEETALEGMKRVKKDPYAVSCHRLPGGVTFLNGMSANDPQSTATILERYRTAQETPPTRTVVLLNCRPDRGYRTNLMTDYITEAAPDAVWLTGSGRQAAAAALARKGVGSVCVYKNAESLPLTEQSEGTLIYAIGNIAGPGIDLMARVEKEGKRDVW